MNLYKRLLNLELWHDYYLGQPDPPETLPTNYDISSTLTLVPTSDCLRSLRNLRWIFRPQSHGGSLFAQVAEVSPNVFKTVLKIDRPLRLTFWLVVRDRYFANFTNLPLTTTRKQIYYFSNTSGNQGQALFLTQPLSAYAANSEYRLGQLVSYAGKTLEALRFQAAANTIPNDSDWDTLPNSQYVSELDLLPRQGLYRTYNIANANPGDRFRLTLVDVNQQETYALEATIPDRHIPGDDFAVNLNFAGQIPGRYRLLLNGSEVDDFVLFDPLTGKDAFALVEIAVNSNAVSTTFSLLQTNAGNTLIQPKTYVIRYKNRSTRWRYRYEKPHGFTADKLPDFELIDVKTYATKRPLGLRLRPDSLLTDGKDNPLPAPGVTLIKPEIKQPSDMTIYSDIHL
ncbi:hypothetical protein HCG51_06310 [Tolypothrix sp. PCC 7910]|uniref:hypothetical protein n=1 Tax=Tolypothrix sp. PCC 7910 TaxID=2099387 RepID=UPI0014279777|nr:hypothetical protein [Tolypothrix sp. PCC 7910]QIR36409.1 hypothetical protein HCG51_06310 [Tolypothrix sp. PCC 7910]